VNGAPGAAGPHAALLRGINVGRAKRVAMADLRGIVAGLGYQDVRTLLNSGNVVFTAPRPAPDGHGARIEKAITERLGIRARVIVLTGAELAAAVRANPLGDVAVNPSRYLVAVLESPADRKALEPLMKQDWSPEVLALGRRVAYLWCPDGLLVSRLGAAVGKLLRDRLTTRNWSTMTKLNALANKETS
jgi:uncharacterized protein (DUF1697 family)